MGRLIYTVGIPMFMERNTLIFVILLLVSTVLLGLLILFDASTSFIYLALGWIIVVVLIGGVVYGLEPAKE